MKLMSMEQMKQHPEEKPKDVVETQKKPMFVLTMKKFERQSMWLKVEGFRDVIKEWWQKY